MRVLLEERIMNQYDTRQLFEEVIKLFDDFNAKQFFAQEYLCKISKDVINLKSLNHKKMKKDLTFRTVLKRDQCLNYVVDFEKKIEFLKSQLTDDEMIVYTYSLEERELDNIILNRLNKSPHKYYQIKKSCYLKIALLFRLVPSIEENSCLEITQMI